MVISRRHNYNLIFCCFTFRINSYSYSVSVFTYFNSIILCICYIDFLLINVIYLYIFRLFTVGSFFIPSSVRSTLCESFVDVLLLILVTIQATFLRKLLEHMGVRVLSSFLSRSIILSLRPLIFYF